MWQDWTGDGLCLCRCAQGCSFGEVEVEIEVERRVRVIEDLRKMSKKGQVLSQEIKTLP